MFAIVKIDILLNSTKIFKNINKFFNSFIKDKIFHNISLYFSSSFLDDLFLSSIFHP
jgi:hypothetical protein